MSLEPSKPAEERELTLPEALALAVELHRTGRRDEAEPVYRAVLQAAPDQPDALHFLGVLAHQGGRSAEAEGLIRRALELDPDLPDAWNNLGNLLKDAGRLAEAEGAYRRTLELRPEHVGALNNLGVVLKEQGRREEAVAALDEALALCPEYADAHYNLGNALRHLGRVKEAVEAHYRAIALNPHMARSRNLLSQALYKLGRVDEAVRVLDEWLALEPGHPVASHLRAACSGKGVPDRASDAFVREIFDGFAPSFDERLKGLDYRAPELVAAAVAKTLSEPAADLDVLDAGCGTGLCGPLLRPYARRLLGVDLSPPMLERARERGTYDQLEAAELTEYLAAHPEAFDLVASADTLCYFGALEAAIEAAARALRPGGLLAFTVERAEAGEAPGGFGLRHHGRYCHEEEYLRGCLAAAGLEPRSLETATLRSEGGEPVAGVVVVAGRAFS